MRKSALKLLTVILSCLVVLLPACSPPATIAPSPTAPPASSTPPVTSTPTHTVAPLPYPTATETTAPATINYIPTTFEQPGGWKLQHRNVHPNAPKLVNASAEGYLLDPGFQVASIELAYRWLGMSAEAHEYERIERREDTFWRDGTQISADAVQKLIHSIANLYAEPVMLTSSAHSDDYPFWAIELTDINGSTVFLYSDSNADNFTPWNVVYNGEIFVQFNGQIAIALSDLFSIAQRQRLVPVWGVEGEPSYLSMGMVSNPDPLSRGFKGLLPLYWDFYYQPNSQKGELSGWISGFDWGSDVGGWTIHWLSDLRAMELVAGDGQVTPCTLDTSIEPDAEDVMVRHAFSCPVGKPSGNTYSYPIRLTYINAEDQSYTLSGELFGYWESPVFISTVSYPDEVERILKDSPLSADLLSDHLFIATYPVVKADLRTGSIEQYLATNAVLLGQAQVGERIIPYTVMLNQVRIEQGKLVYWDLDRSKLTALLQAVLAQPVTQRFLEADPNPKLNLYYAEVYDQPLVKSDDLKDCADLPSTGELPRPGQPFRGFSFNQQPPLSSGYYSTQILLLQDGIRIYHLNLDPASPGDAFWMSMLPPSLKPQDAPPFLNIWTRLGSPDIGVRWAEDSSDVQVSYYTSMFSGWEVEKLTYDQGLLLLNRTFRITPDGQLELVAC